MESTEPTFGMNTTVSKGKKKRLMIIIAVLVVALLALTVYLLAGRSETVDADDPVATVSATQEGFTPGTIKVKAGDDVAWVNEDIVAHEVFADQATVPGLDSTQPLSEGDTYVFTFDKKGTYNYYDPLNPTGFKGTVIVE